MVHYFTRQPLMRVKLFRLCIASAYKCLYDQNMRIILIRKRTDKEPMKHKAAKMMHNFNKISMKRGNI